MKTIAMMCCFWFGISQANASQNVFKCRAESTKNEWEIGVLTFDLDRLTVKTSKMTYGFGGDTIQLQKKNGKNGATIYGGGDEETFFTFYVPDERYANQFKMKIKIWTNGDGDNRIEKMTLVCD